MPEFTADGVYVPQRTIVIASSFEGVVNDGAPECGLVSFNAYQQMEEGKGGFFGRVVEPEDFGTIRGSREMQAFLRIRPVVEVAEDYLTVLEVIDSNPVLVDTMLSDPDNPAIYDPLIDRFRQRKEESADARGRFKTAFYAERKRMQEKDWDIWSNLQSPFPDAIVELRNLRRTQRRGDDGSVERGFVPRYATSKDEASTWQLCVLYTRMQKLAPEDVGEGGAVQCIISKDGIIGLEHTRDKLKQLQIFAEQFGVPHSQVWRLNDRYDIGQQQELWDNGFHYQFLVRGGYAFPHDYRKAKEDGMVAVVDRKGMAKALGEYTQKWRF